MRMTVGGVVAGIVLAVMSTGSLADGTPRPDALLIVDQHREAIVDRVVREWPETLSAEQSSVLRKTLAALRADRLFAISISPGLQSLLGVLEVVDKVEVAKDSRATVKALGDIGTDVVYTPVTPCRIVDTRYGAGGTLSAGNTRNWLAANPSGTFTAQGGSATNCGIPVKPAAVMVNLTVANTQSGPALITAWPFNQTKPNAATLNWVAAGTQLANAVILPLCTAGNCTSDWSLWASSGTDLIVDVMGYFAAPASGLVTPDMRPPTVVDATGRTVGTLQVAAQNPLHRLVYRTGGDLFVFPIEYFIDERQVSPATPSGELLFESADCSGQAYIERRAPVHFLPAGPRIGLLVYAPGNPPGPYTGHWLLYATAPGSFYQKDVPFVARSARSNYPAICQVFNSQLKTGFPMNVIEDLASKFVEPYGLK